MKIEKFSDNMMDENCYVITDEKSGESAVIDPGFDESKLLKYIKKSNVKYILLTHGHFDHIGAVYDIKELTGAKVCISKADEPCLNDNEKNLSKRAFGFKIKDVNADIIFNDGDIIKLGDKEIKVISTPGHSEGSVCYVIESEKVIFSGDTLFHRSIGRTDFPDGDIEKMYASLRLLMKFNPEYDVYPGHGCQTTIATEAEQNMYIREMGTQL